MRYEKQGFWWLPASPENRVPGTLVFGDETDSQLQLLGSLLGGLEGLKIMSLPGVHYRPDLILGVSSDGSKYTLVHCLQTACNLNSNGFVVEHFRPWMVIEGRHFSAVNEIVFQQAGAKLDHFGEWYQRTGREVVLEDVDKGTWRTTITCCEPDNVAACYGSGRIEFGHDGNIKFGGFREDLIISEEACFVLFPDAPISISDFLDELLPPFLNFFSLGVGRTLSILEVRGKVAMDCVGKTVDDIRRAPTVKLYWEKPEGAHQDSELLSHDMVFTCPDLGDSLEKCLKTWLRIYSEIKPVMQLFFGTVLPETRISANSFVNTIQTVEAYHRFRRDGTELPEVEHSVRVSSILGAVKGEHREWLGRKLEHSNEIGLRKRLKELLRERTALLKLSCADINGLAHRARELRNSFTHYAGNGAPNFGSAQELYCLGELFKWVIIACLLEEMGISRERAHLLIERNESFSYFRSIHLKEMKAGKWASEASSLEHEAKEEGA